MLSTAGLLGAGDAKFAAAMAPFFPLADLRFVLALFAAAILGAFVGHRAARAIGPVRAVTPDWQSWTHKDFPMGLALSGMLVIYLPRRALCSRLADAGRPSPSGLPARRCPWCRR